MRQFVESLKRLYSKQKLTKQKLFELFNEKKITEEEKRYIEE